MEQTLFFGKIFVKKKEGTRSAHAALTNRDQHAEVVFLLDIQIISNSAQKEVVFFFKKMERTSN